MIKKLGMVLVATLFALAIGMVFVSMTPSAFPADVAVAYDTTAPPGEQAFVLDTVVLDMAIAAIASTVAANVTRQDMTYVNGLTSTPGKEKGQHQMGIATERPAYHLLL